MPVGGLLAMLIRTRPSRPSSFSPTHPALSPPLSAAGRPHGQVKDGSTRDGSTQSRSSVSQLQGGCTAPADFDYPLEYHLPPPGSAPLKRPAMSVITDEGITDAVLTMSSSAPPCQTSAPLTPRPHPPTHFPNLSPSLSRPREGRD